MSLARKSVFVTGATLVSRFLGFVRDALMAAILGAGPLTDAFVTAFQIPNLARRLLAEGALNGAFVPIHAATRAGPDGPAAARQFVFGALGVSVVAMLALTAAALVLMPWLVGLLAPGFAGETDLVALASSFGRLAVGYVVFAAVVAILAGWLNALGHVRAVAILPIAFNVTMITALVVAWGLGFAAQAQAGIILAAGVLAAGVVQALVAAVATLRLPERGVSASRWRWTPALSSFFGRAGPVLLVAALPQLKLIAGIVTLSSTTGAVSWLWYAHRLFELPLGLVSALVASILIPVLSTVRAAGADPAGARDRAIEAALALSIPAATGLAVLASDIVTVLFQRGAFLAADTAATAPMLAALALGLPGYVLEKVLAADAFAHDDATSPLIAGLSGLAFAVTGASLAGIWFGPSGVALAIGLSGYVGCGVLLVLARRADRTSLAPPTCRALWAIPLAAGAMAAALFLLSPWLAGFAPILRLTMLIAVGMAVYCVAVLATRAIDINAFRRRAGTEPLA